MKDECGVTEISLANGRELAKENGSVQSIDLVKTEGYNTVVVYKNGQLHTFTGFAWGYNGEGPAGLEKWARENEVAHLLSWEMIESLENSIEGPVLRIFLAG